MAYRHLRIAREESVERLTLHRPEVRNAIDDELVAELGDWARGFHGGNRARVVVLEGAGKVFCAGADLAWMTRVAAYSHDENLSDAAALADVFAAIDALPAPVIGRVHGAALGGGAGLAAVCDIVVAADDAIFGFTEVKLGILPAVISPFAVAKIGVSAARELFLTGARFTAERARQIGLVHAVVPLADLDATVDAYVRDLLTSAPGAVAAAKALIPRVAGGATADTLRITAEAIARQRVSAEGQAGMHAFLEKAKAPWIEE